MQLIDGRGNLGAFTNSFLVASRPTWPTWGSTSLRQSTHFYPQVDLPRKAYVVHIQARTRKSARDVVAWRCRRSLKRRWQVGMFWWIHFGTFQGWEVTVTNLEHTTRNVILIPEALARAKGLRHWLSFLQPEIGCPLAAPRRPIHGTLQVTANLTA
jgi:hypothetical protein